MSTESGLRRAKPSTRKVGLDRETVVDTALRILDEDGLEALTIRSVARRLGVYPTTIYWHVAGLDNLLSAVVSRVTEAAVADSESPTDNWRDRLRETARRYRAAVHDHPNIAPALVTSGGTDSALRFPLVERYLRALVRAGFRGDALAHAYNAFFGAVVGYVAMELAGVSGSTSEDEGWKGQLRRDIADLSPEQYPTLADNRDAVQGRVFAVRWRNGVDQPLEEGFELLLDALIVGLESLSPQR